MRERILRECANDLEKFGRTFMPRTFYAETPLFHKRINEMLLDHSIKRKAIIAPRGHAKSTKSSIIFPLHQTLFNPRDNELLIMIISEAQSQSIAFLNIIGWNLSQNKRIRSIFGNLVGDRWREEELSTTNNVRILAKGTGQRMRGSVSGREGVTRPNIIILDDFESETNSNTPEAIEKNKKWIVGAVEPSLADNGVLIATGTLISEAAYLSEIRKDSAWKVMFLQALMNETADGPGNIPIFPSRFTHDDIMAKKRSYEARGQGAIWWREYMNKCNDVDRQIFPRERFKYFDYEFQLVDGVQPALIYYKDGVAWMRPLYVTIGVDLAISENLDADYTVAMVVGQDSQENFYVLDYWRERTGDVDRVTEKLFELSMNYGCMLVNIEKVQYQQAMVNYFEKRMRERNYWIGVEGTRPRSSKDARIKTLQPIFAEGKLLHRAYMTDLEGELEYYPNPAHKDMLDALYYGVSISSPAQLGDRPLGHPAGLVRSRGSRKEVSDWLVL